MKVFGRTTSVVDKVSKSTPMAACTSEILKRERQTVWALTLLKTVLKPTLDSGFKALRVGEDSGNANK